MKNKHFLYCLIAFLIACLAVTKANAQNPTAAELYKITQVSPNSASLGKYGEYPVGMYTGTPDINIPFYEIDAGRIRLPIGLSYHSGGIKVEEIASSVGLGWSLNAGGVITRTVMGLPDEEPYPGNTETFVNTNITVDSVLARLGNINIPALDNYNYLKKIIAGKIDGEPDVFYFNFGQVSGKFMYHQKDHKFYSIPYSKLRIEFSNQPGNTAFTVTDDKGIQYVFADMEVSHRQSNDVGNPDVPVTTSWYLTSVFDPVSQQTVTFSYEDYTLSYDTMAYEALYFADFKADVIVNPKQDIFHYLKRVKSITYSGGHITLDYMLSRCDLPGDYALTSLKVYNDNNKLVKSYGLNYDYFFAAGYTTTINCSNAEEAVNKRLKLTGVDEKPTDGSTTPSQPYSFDYNDITIPSRFSKAQDHWGFYNGADGNQHLYPSYVVTTTPLRIVSGGNREINPTYCQAGNLKSISYPTGGHTNFEFECNTSPAADLPDLQTQNYITGRVEDQQNRHDEVPFTVTSNPGPGNNYNSNGGAFMTLNINGLNVDLLHALFNGGLALSVSYINTDTNVGDDLFTYGGPKGNTSLAPVTFYLPNGNYKLIYDCSENPIPESYEEASAYMTWTTTAPDPNLNHYVGGLRVKRIVNYKDQTNVATIKSYKYVTEQNPLLSSGETRFKPSYVDHVMYSSAVQGDLDIPTYTKLHSSSNYPLVSENGKSVGYSNVIELNGDDDSNGYTQYQYTNFSQYDDQYYGTYSNSLPISYQWLRGLELNKKIFKKNTGQNKLVSETINEYDTELLGTNKKTFNGIRGIFISNTYGLALELPGEDMLFLSEAAPGWETHPTYADFVYLKKSTERLYNNNNYVENIKVNTYNTRNFLPSVVQSSNSSGETLFAHTIYPSDYTVDGATNPKALGIKNLQDLNFISQPIEQFSEKQQGAGDKKLIGGIYNSFATLKPLIDTVFYQSIPAAGINNYAGISINANSFIKSPVYQPEIVVERYDQYSNSLLQQKKNFGPSHSYIWDYQGTLPTAEIIGAAYDEAAYTSFEAEGKGNWLYSGTPAIDATAPTGKKVYNLTTSNPISKNDLNSGKQYILSYWVKGSSGASISGSSATVVINSNGWTKYTRLVSGVSAITITGTETVDDIRIYPADAQMTTSTYDLLVGMTSMTDAKGQTTYYEYDNFNRLINIKDQYGNIIKHTDYHYANN